MDSTRKKVLVICPQARDRRELASCRHEIIYHPFSDEDPVDIEALIQSIGKEIDGIISSGDYPGSLLSSVLAHELGLRGPHPKTILMAQHKYYARLEQKRLVPEATAEFTLVSPDVATCKLPYPFFLKPVKSFFSAYAYSIHSITDFRRALENPLPERVFLEPLGALMRRYTECELDAYHLIGESLLEGLQCTLDGYICKGLVTVMGIVDSLFFPGTLSFSRFEYPSRLPPDVQKRMQDIATTYVLGAGLDDMLFNIEFMYNPKSGSIKIIELNSRMSSQAADLYEKVDGTNSYEIAVDIALGDTPQFIPQMGKYNVSASIVLRLFKDQYVRRVPTEEEIAALTAIIPDLRVQVCSTAGKWLSEELQDTQSFRYGLVHLGADSWDELDKKFELCKERLALLFLLDDAASERLS